MEVDERLRWLEARISSSLRPRGEEMRSLFSDEENRWGEANTNARVAICFGRIMGMGGTMHVANYCL